MPIIRRLCLPSVFVLLLASGVVEAFAADTQKTSEATFLIEIALLVLVGRLLGEGMVRIGQPAVMGQLLAGILLGPSFLGRFWPGVEGVLFPAQAQRNMIEGIAAFGVLMLLLLSGMETDLALVRRIGRPAVLISIFGIVVPFACGVALGELLPAALMPNPGERTITALFLGTALSISSVKIVATVIRDLGFQRRNVGQLVLASAILDDTIAWILVGIISGLALNRSLDIGVVAKGALGTALFLGLSFTIGRRIVSRLIRWTNDTFQSEMPVITLIILLMLTMALITDAIGVHSVLGAFILGILVGNSPLLTRQIAEQLRGLVSGLFMPVFFGLSGLSADAGILADPHLLVFTIGLVAIASVGKFGGAFAGGRLAGLSQRECLAIGCAMNARGSTEVIIATIGLSVGVLDQRLYTMIVAMALITTLAMPPLLRWALARMPISKDEEERLAREAFAARSFVAQVERLLIAVDESNNGRFTSRLAGLIAGARGLPSTVLHLTHGVPEQLSTSARDLAGDDPKTASETVKIAAISSQAVQTAVSEEKPDAVDVTTRVSADPVEQAIASEARKGYGLLFVGIERVFVGSRFTDEATKIAEAFNGPLAIADARGTHLENPLDPRLNILVPVTGTEGSHRALEIALTLARSSNGRVTALYVSEKGRPGRYFAFGRALWAMRNEDAVLRQAADLADQYDTPMRTAASTQVAPAEAILRRVKRARYDLIVMGVRRRPGDNLFFGNVARDVLEGADRSILLLAE